MEEKRAVEVLGINQYCVLKATFLDIFVLTLVRLKLKRNLTVAQVNVGSLALISPF